MAQKILFETTLTENATTDIEGVGNLRYGSDGKVYRWVKNDGATATTNDLVAGQPVCHSDASSADTRHESVIDTVSAGDEEMLAGVAMSAIPAVNYGWIQVKGLCITAQVDNSGSNAITIGDSLKVVAGEEGFSYAAAGGNIPKNLPAIAWEAVASATSAEHTVMLNCAV